MKRNTKTSRTPSTVASLAALARLENVSRATATRWNRDGAVVWDDDEIDVQATRRLVKELAGPTKDPRLQEARLEILKAEASLRRLKLKQREGELVELAEVEAILREVFPSIKIGFAGFVPWLYAEVHQVGHKDQRVAFYEISERVDQVVFSVYVSLAQTMARLTGKNVRKAERAVMLAWRSAFGRSWEDELDKILEKYGPVGPPPLGDQEIAGRKAGKVEGGRDGSNGSKGGHYDV